MGRREANSGFYNQMLVRFYNNRRKSEMKKIKKMLVLLLSAVMLITYMPAAECFAGDSTEYTSATEIEYNKIYIAKIPKKEEYDDHKEFVWYKFTPRTSSETVTEIVVTMLSGLSYASYEIYDSSLAEIGRADLGGTKKLKLDKGATYYLRIHNYYTYQCEVSVILKSIGKEDNNGTSDNISDTSDQTQTPGDITDNRPNTDFPNNNSGTNGNNNQGNNSIGNNDNQGSDSNGSDQDTDNDDIDSDFWDDDVDDNNGSDVYDDELPVPEITEVENGNRSITIVWSCDDADSIDGYYIYRSKDGKKWDKLATIRDTEIEDYEDKDVADGDICGYVIRSYTGESQSENSVPEYTCFLKKVTIKSVKSNASKKLNVKWSTNSKSSGYQIRFSTTKSYTNTTTSSVTVNSKSESSKTIGKLKGGKKYYVQIRAFRKYNGEVYYSGWTPTKSVKVKS